MRTKRLIAVLVLAGLHVCQAPASAAECGTAAKGGEVLRGTLTLDDRASTTRQDFRRDQDPRALQVVFDVANCEVTSPPEVSGGPLKDVDQQIPEGALGVPKVQALGNEVKISYRVRPDRFDPGTYGSLLEVSDPGRLETARTAINLSRSEPSLLWPGVVGLVAGALGFAIFYWSRRFARYRVVVSNPMMAVAIFIACGAGALAAVLNWSDQDVWVLQDNWDVAATTAFTQATAGAAVLMLAGVFSEEPEDGEPLADPVLGRAQFWRRAFDALPPSFIKSVEVEDGKLVGETEHIVENMPFKRFEVSGGATDDEEERLIKRDHRRGDELAITAGRSWQLEWSDTHGLLSGRQIVTYKRMIEYEGRTFILGWYLPAELPPDIDGDTHAISVQQFGFQPVARLVRASGSGDQTLKVHVARSSLRAAGLIGPDDD